MVNGIDALNTQAVNKLFKGMSRGLVGNWCFSDAGMNVGVFTNQMEE